MSFGSYSSSSSSFSIINSISAATNAAILASAGDEQSNDKATRKYHKKCQNDTTWANGTMINYQLDNGTFVNGTALQVMKNNNPCHRSDDDDLKHSIKMMCYALALVGGMVLLLVVGNQIFAWTSYYKEKLVQRFRRRRQPDPEMQRDEDLGQYATQRTQRRQAANCFCHNTPPTRPAPAAVPPQDRTTHYGDTRSRRQRLRPVLLSEFETAARRPQNQTRSRRGASNTVLLVDLARVERRRLRAEAEAEAARSISQSPPPTYQSSQQSARPTRVPVTASGTGASLTMAEARQQRTPAAEADRPDSPSRPAYQPRPSSPSLQALPTKPSPQTSSIRHSRSGRPSGHPPGRPPGRPHRQLNTGDRQSPRDPLSPSATPHPRPPLPTNYSRPIRRRNRSQTRPRRRNHHPSPEAEAESEAEENSPPPYTEDGDRIETPIYDRYMSGNERGRRSWREREGNFMYF